MRSNGRVEESTKLTLKERQLKNDAKAEVLAEQEANRKAISDGDASRLVADVVRDMSLYSVFENETVGINGELDAIDSHIADLYETTYGFDTVEELQTLKNDAQKALNNSLGTPVEQVAREAFKAIERKEGDIVAELVGLSENAEDMTF